CSPSLAKGLRLVQNGTIQPFERRRHAVQRALEVSGARGLMHKAARSCCGGGGGPGYCPATDEWFDARAQLVTPPEQEAQRESLRHAMTLFLEHALVCKEHKKFMRKHKLIEWA